LNIKIKVPTVSKSVNPNLNAVPLTLFKGDDTEPRP